MAALRRGRLCAGSASHDVDGKLKRALRKKGVRHPGIIGAVKGCRSEWKIVVFYGRCGRCVLFSCFTSSRGAAMSVITDTHSIPSIGSKSNRAQRATPFLANIESRGHQGGCTPSHFRRRPPRRHRDGAKPDISGDTKLHNHYRSSADYTPGGTSECLPASSRGRN